MLLRVIRLLKHGAGGARTGRAVARKLLYFDSDVELLPDTLATSQNLYGRPDVKPSPELGQRAAVERFFPN